MDLMHKQPAKLGKIVNIPNNYFDCLSVYIF